MGGFCLKCRTSNPACSAGYLETQIYSLLQVESYTSITYGEDTEDTDMLSGLQVVVLYFNAWLQLIFYILGKIYSVAVKAEN